MMTRRLLVLTLLLAGCAKSAETAKSGDAIAPTFKVALVTPGSVADAAWNQGAFTGLQQIRDSLGAAISHIEAHTPAEQEEALRNYASEGYTVVFGHGFEFQELAERVSQSFPETIFAITSGERVNGKVVPVIFRIHEATYLAGMVAGAMTRSGKIGFIGGMPLPPIKLGYQGWLQGAQATRPKVDSRLTWLNTFDDVAAGKEAALAMIKLGVDQLHHNADAAALGAFSAGNESPGVYLYGANADQTSLAPERVIGSAALDLPRAFLLIAREVKDGKFTPHIESFGLESNVVRFDTNPKLDSLWPKGLRERIAAAADSIKAGTITIKADSAK